MSETQAAPSGSGGETGETGGTGGTGGRGESVRDYLQALASDAPAPGGGSAAGLAGAMGAALVSMVANFTVGRPRFADVEARVRGALDAANGARDRLASLMQADEQAYAAYAAAAKLPRGTDEEKRARSKALQQALRDAAAPPLAMAAVCREVLDLAGIVAADGNARLASDAGVAALLAEAALRASAVNVRVNLGGIRDASFVARTEAELNRLLEGTPALREDVLAVAGRRMTGG